VKIGVATNDWSRSYLDGHGRPTYGGAGWYRLGLPARHLRAQGLDVVEGTLAWANDAKRFGIREWPGHGDDPENPMIHWDVDLVVLQRWMFASVAFETPTARRSGQVVVQDVDDHFWALDPANRAQRATDPRLNKVENRDHYLAGIKAASAVTVSTPYLASELRRAGVRVPIHVLPNHLDVEAFAQVRQARPWRASPIVGWVGATQYRSGDVETLRGFLGPFLNRHDLTAYHSGHVEGAATSAAQARLQPERVRHAPLAPIETYPFLFRGLDVGLVPLRNVPFNQAKSAIKGLEYAAAGVPFVAADLPEYVRLHADRGIGRLARRTRDWTRNLEALLDPIVRAEEAAKNLAAVEALDIRRGVHQWRDLYLELLATA